MVIRPKYRKKVFFGKMRKQISSIIRESCRRRKIELLEAGVTIYEYVGGLLHTNSLTLDGQVTLICSANMDRRSFDLNYENKILFCDSQLQGAPRAVHFEIQYRDPRECGKLVGITSSLEQHPRGARADSLTSMLRGCRWPK